MEEHRRFEELWDGKEDPEDRIIRLREDDGSSPARRRNRIFFISFILSALMFIAALIIVLKAYLT